MYTASYVEPDAYDPTSDPLSNGLFLLLRDRLRLPMPATRTDSSSRAPASLGHFDGGNDRALRSIAVLYRLADLLPSTQVFRGKFRYILGQQHWLVELYDVCDRPLPEVADRDGTHSRDYAYHVVTGCHDALDTNDRDGTVDSGGK